MKGLGKTVEKRYATLRHRGKPVVVRYRYDREVDRWTATSPNVPQLIAENDSIEEIERHLPDILDLIADTERTHGPAANPGTRNSDEQ